MSKTNPVGRPSGYDPKYVQELLDYFDVEPYKEALKTVASQGKAVAIDVTEANDFPTFAGFAVHIGVHRETILNWTKEFPEFFDAYKKAKEMQENFLVVNGLKSLLNPAFAIFTAKNVLGWRDKQPGEVDVVVNNNFEQKSDEELDARLKKLMEGSSE